MVKLHNIHRLTSRRRELRKNQTLGESLLWARLRYKKIGVKFRRQHSVGGYVLDFYCSERKLIIEIDGSVHHSIEAKEYDAVRDKFFEELGYTTLRFTNTQIENDPEKVLKTIINHL